jgi:hypothetical protein
VIESCRVFVVHVGRSLRASPPREAALVFGPPVRRYTWGFSTGMTILLAILGTAILVPSLLFGALVFLRYRRCRSSGGAL